MNMNKTILGTIIGAALLGIAKGKNEGSGNIEDGPFDAQTLEGIKNKIHELGVIDDILITTNNDMYILFNTLSPIEDLQERGIHGYRNFENFFPFHTKKYYPPNPNVKSFYGNAYYWSVMQDVWLDTGRRPPDTPINFDKPTIPFPKQMGRATPEPVVDLQGDKSLFWKPVDELPPLFLTHSVRPDALNYIGRKGFMYFPSMALSPIPSIGVLPISLVIDASIIPNHAFTDDRLVVFSSDSGTHTYNLLETLKDLMDIERSGIHDDRMKRNFFLQMPNPKRGIETLAGAIGFMGAEHDYDNSQTRRMDDWFEYQEAGIKGKVRIISSMDQLKEEYKNKEKFHFTNSFGQRDIMFRTRSQRQKYFEERGFEIKRQNILDSQFHYMEPKFYGKLGVDSIVGIVANERDKDIVEDFCQQIDFKGEVIYYYPEDEDSGLTFNGKELDVPIQQVLDYDDEYIHSEDYDSEKQKIIMSSATIATYARLKSKGLL